MRGLQYVVRINVSKCKPVEQPSFVLEAEVLNVFDKLNSKHLVVGLSANLVV